jgi:formate C-acetyltransferase
MEYAQHSPMMAGLSHTADSLAVIKKLCFEDKTLKWPELLDGVRSNWLDREHLRQVVMTRVPAYGNDCDYVDSIATEITKYFVDSVRRHSAEAKTKIKFLPGVGTFEIYTAMGSVIGATPDGRFSGEPLSTNASPSLGRTMSGQTAALNSYFKLPLTSLPAGVCIDLNMQTKTALLSQLEALIRSFVEQKGSLMTITVNDCSKLREAQKHPERYRDLLVRVGGYQAYFVDLPPCHQDLQIRKCEQYD